MGKKAINRVIAGIGKGVLAAQENYRQDKEKEAQNAFKDRELTLREEEAAIRQQNLQLEQMQTKTKMNHAQLVRTAMSSGYTNKNMGYGSQAMAGAMTQYVGDGRAYRHKEYDENGMPVWEVGTYETDATTGKPIADPSTGKPKFLSLKDEDGNSRQITFKDAQEYTGFINSNMKPDYLFGLQAAERTYDMTRRENKAKLDELRKEKEMLAETPQGKDTSALKKAQTRQASAAADKAEAQAAATKAGKMSDAEVKAMGQLADDLRQHYPGSAIDPTTAKRMAAITSDPKVRARVAADISTALNSENQAMALEDFIKAGTSQGFPRAFMEKIVEEALTGYEAAEEASVGSDGWIMNALQNLGNYFKGD